METLSLRRLNRATLARQLLLERRSLPITEAIECLAGLNAQYWLSPYLSLWSRLDNISRNALMLEIGQRTVVRATLMRSTLHLVTARDYLSFQPALQSVLLRAFRGYFREEAGRINLERLCEAASGYLSEEARTFPELRTYLSSIEPGEDPASLSFAVRARLPLVQIPPAGTWGFTGSPRYLAATDWLKQEVGLPDEGHLHLILRYLKAFGPASRQDLEAWSGMTGLRTIIKELKLQLRIFVDEQGRELLDVADGPLPDPDTPVPPRFLPDWDNLLLAHADRSRVLPDAYRKSVIQIGGHVLPTFLLDGFVAGTWCTQRTGEHARLWIKPFTPLQDTAPLVAEGEQLLRFIEDDATRFTVEIP